MKQKSISIISFISSKLSSEIIKQAQHHQARYGAFMLDVTVALQAYKVSV